MTEQRQKQIFKNIFFTLSAFLLMCFMRLNISAEAHYVETSYADARLTISYGTANCTIKIYGDRSANSISNINIALTDTNNVVISKWENLSSDVNKFFTEKTVGGLEKGKTYTLTVSGTVNGNGSHETVSDSVTVSY